MEQQQRAEKPQESQERQEQHQQRSCHRRSLRTLKGDGAVSPKEVAAKLEVIFSMQPPLREAAEQLATHLQHEFLREHAARMKMRLLVVPPPTTRPAKMKKDDKAAPEASAPSARHLSGEAKPVAAHRS